MIESQKRENKEKKTPETAQAATKQSIFYMPDKFIINKSYNKSRFDKWFKEEVIDLPNSLIQKLLRKGLNLLKDS